MSIPRRARLRDVAVLAGVDVSIVSRVLNNAEVRVQLGTRQRILDAAAQLGYRPNSNARGLRLSRSNTIGLVIPNFANPVYAPIINAVSLCAAERGYAVVMQSVQTGLEDQYEHMVTENRVDGLLMGGALGDSTGVERLETLGVPVVLFNRTVPGAVASVVLNDEGASKLAVEHLASLGHRRIAHITGIESADTTIRRRRGYEAGINELGLDTSSELVVPGGYDEASGSRAMTALLDARVGATAVVVANVVAAFGSILTARERGVRIPGELSLIAIHDNPFAAYCSPALTTVAMPLDQLGVRAVGLLVDRLGGKPGANVVITEPPPRLVVRESTAPPGRQ